MGTLYVVATPIGNLEDITIRAIKILLASPVIACEDTRRTGQLIKILKDRYKDMLKIQCPTFIKYLSIRDWNEVEAKDKVLQELVNSDVALVSDSGTPLISDPGYKLVRAAKDGNIPVIPIPGACAATAAISVSGLPTNKYIFWGFLPKKWDLIPETTHIIYESPKRVQKTVETLSNKYPNAEIVIASELTKIYENIFVYKNNPALLPKKGEVTILVYIWH